MSIGWWESYWNVLYIETFRDRRVADMGASFSVCRLGGGGLVLIPGGVSRGRACRMFEVRICTNTYEGLGGDLS